MSPNPAKNTFSTNHVQTLEAIVKNAQKALEKYKEAKLAQELNQSAATLLKELDNLKKVTGDENRQLDKDPFKGAKAKVDEFAKQVKASLVDFGNVLKAEHCTGLETMVKQALDALGKNKDAAETEDGKKILAAADVLTKRINNLKREVGKALITGKDYVDIKATAGKLISETKVALEKLAKAPKVVYKFNGAEVATEADLINKIKAHLPSNGHNNINQALNDAVLGRGKSTGSVSCLHASAGKKGKNAGGCTLFFKRSGAEIDVIGVGQHSDAGKNQTSYTIHFGLSGKKNLVL